MYTKTQILILVLLGISASICFIFAFVSGPESSFCQSENDILCKKCPPNARCNFKDFECQDGFLKNKEQCLFTSIPEEKLRKLHIQVKNLRKNNIKNHNINLHEVSIKLNISEIDAKAAILYDEDFIINNNNKIIRKPPPLNSIRIRILFLLISIVFILVLCKPSYDNYGLFALSILAFFFSQSALDKLIKGLL